MFQAPATIWNQVMQEGAPLRTEWAEQMFSLTPEQMGPAIQAELDRAQSESGSPLVAAAYLVTAPLLWEVEAIKRYLAVAGPVGSLPVVESVDDALAVAQGDYRLDPVEAETLRLMLLREPRPA